MEATRKNLVNYSLTYSNSNNYSTYNRSSSPESFPEVIDNGIFVIYDQVNFVSDICEVENDNLKVKELTK